MKLRSSLSLVSAAVLAATLCGAARADSTYGYNTTTFGTTTLMPRWAVAVTVPVPAVL